MRVRWRAGSSEGMGMVSSQVMEGRRCSRAIGDVGSCRSLKTLLAELPI